MARICHGSWINSAIGGQPDGTIDVEEDEITGLLGGRHHNSKKGIFGVCDNSANPHVTFVRFDKGEAVIYHGDIVRVNEPDPHFEIRNGSVTVVGRDKSKKPAAGDWTAEKQT